MRVAAVPHIGPYARIGVAFDRVCDRVEAVGLFARGTAVITVYHDDPGTCGRASALRAEAAVSIPADAPIPRGTHAMWLPAGLYARATHVGPYSNLGDAWERLSRRWLTGVRYRRGPGVCYEIYRDEPGDVPEEGLRTDLYLPLVAAAPGSNTDPGIGSSSSNRLPSGSRP